MQDYVVVPRQLWLDGIASSGGAVKQFVATPLGDGYTVEAQITKEEAHGGLQFEITPAIVYPNETRSIAVFMNGAYIDFQIAKDATGQNLMRKIELFQGIPIRKQRLLAKGYRLKHDAPIPLEHDVVDLLTEQRGGGCAEPPSEKVEMGIAAGGNISQTIVRDPWPTKMWHKKATIAFNVHLLNAKVFEKITGMAAPETPVTIKTYKQLCLPFYELYEEPSTIHGAFENIKSIGEIDGVEERDYTLKTKVINPGAAQKVETARDPEDISNPAGPFSEFQSVSEIEQ